LLKLLWEHEGRPCSHDDIVRGVWGEQAVNIGEADESKIYALALRLRKRIEPDPSTPQYVIAQFGWGLRLDRLAASGPPDCDPSPRR
jgi:DNA-binding winged helix-turn-helix (wHTH) protein